MRKIITGIMLAAGSTMCAAPTVSGQLDYLAGAGELVYSVKVSKGEQRYSASGTARISAVVRERHRELQQKTKISAFLVSYHCLDRLLVRSQDEFVMRQELTHSRSYENLPEVVRDGAIMTYFMDGSQLFLRRAPIDGNYHDYPIPVGPFPLSLDLLPFVIHCRGGFLVHDDGIPAWIVQPYVTGTYHIGKNNVVERRKLRTIRPLEGSSQLPARDVESLVVDTNPVTGFPSEITGRLKGHQIRIWRSRP